jgi:hypothetical protein
MIAPPASSHHHSLMRSVSRSQAVEQQLADDQFRHLIAQNINQTSKSGHPLHSIYSSHLASSLSSASSLIQSSEISLYNLNSFYTVLNQSDVNCCSRKKPHEFVRDLLLRLLKYCKSHLRQGAHHVDVETAREIYQCAEFKTIVNESQELQHLNLNSLKTQNQKLSFFINLHNLLSMHAHFYMAALQNKKQATTQPGNLNDKFFVLNQPENEIPANSCGYLFKTKTEKLLFQQRMCYRVGQMGYVSLYDLKHNILTRHCMNNDSFANLNFASISKSVDMGDVMSTPSGADQNDSELYKFAFYSLDLDAEPLWSPYLPDESMCDYKILFALTNCTESDPPVCVFNSDELLNEQLLMHMKLFLNDSIYANLSDDVLYLPNFLVENCSFFMDGGHGPTVNKLIPFVTTIDNSSTRNDLDCLVRFLMELVNQELRDNLKSKYILQLLKEALLEYI